VSPNEWLEYLVKGIQNGKDHRPGPYVPIYHEWKNRGAAAAVALFRELKRDHADEYSFGESVLLQIGDKLYEKNRLPDAILFLKASLEEYPEGKYNYYIHYELADAHKQLGDKKLAMQYCEKSLELNPDFDAAKALLEELRKN